ncbi:hypothetical protein BDM02DRAFT_3153836 [Thelephora ganbajun]|uniref:Uncharacterized protein n=1 Tax=Thelephora ganbajun TaxID=370292 RepID=A0ACB6ZRZ9_THEGA|nr:hypothetical protein BDM02DRAFT_3153836 [Thelephora ganbajun]
MSTLSTPPALLEAVRLSEETWHSDLHDLFEQAKDRFPDILWERDEDDDATKGPAEVWGHKAIVYARAPPSWQAKYFQFRPAPIGSPTPYSATPSILGVQGVLSLNLNPGIDFANQSRSPSPLRGQSPPPSTHQPGLLRLPITNPAIFPNELEYLYTARGLSQAFEFLFDQSPESREGDEDETRSDKLRKDLVFMWRSRLYSDIKIALTGSFSSMNHESATAIFSSHRFMLVSRSPYFHTSLKSWGKTATAIAKAASGSGEEEPLTVTLPSPPFTPASLHFTLGYVYTGTLVFSHRTYDLDTAFHIMKSATFLSIQSLYDEIQARIVQEMMHGLYHAFLEFSEYERITGGKWGSGGCRCRQCARRAPRVLEFAIADDVKNQHLERGARRALVGIYGEGWCTSEFFKLPEKIKLQLVKGLAKRTTPINIFPLLFATHQALKKLINISDLWSDSVKELVLSARKTIDEVLCNQADECFERPEWVEFMAGDGARFDDADKVEWVMDSVRRGLNELNAPLVYQTLVSSILLRPHPTEREQTMLSTTSHLRVQTEQTRVDVVKWLRRRWVGVKQAGGFDKLEGWSLKELSHEIDVSIDELLNPEMPEHSPHKSMVINRRTVFEEPDSGSMHSVRTGVGRGRVAQLQETPTKRERVHSSASSVRSVAKSTLSTTSRTTTNGTPRNKVLNPNLRPDSKLTPGSSSVLSPTRSSVLSTDQDSRRTPTESRTARNNAPRNPADRVKSSAASVRSHASALRKVPILLNTDPKANALGLSPTNSASRPQSRVSTTSEASTTFKTASDGPSSAGNSNSTVQSTKRTRTVSAVSTKTSLGVTSPTTPSKSPIRARRASVASNLSVKTRRTTTTSSILDTSPSPKPRKTSPAPSTRSTTSTNSTPPVPPPKKTVIARKITPTTSANRKSTASVISTRMRVDSAPSSSTTVKGKGKVTPKTPAADVVRPLTPQRRGSTDTIRQSVNLPEDVEMGDSTTATSTATNPPVQITEPEPERPSTPLPKGATLEIGIPCIISSKRARFRAFARYIGEIEGELGPWVGVEVPMNESWANGGTDDRQWHDGTWGGIKYFDLANNNQGAAGDWDYGDERLRRRRTDMSSSWTSMHSGKGVKRDADHFGFDSRTKRMRSASPAPSDSSSMETRGLFVRPQQVLYVVDAVGSDF